MHEKRFGKPVGQVGSDANSPCLPHRVCMNRRSLFFALLVASTAAAQGTTPPAPTTPQRGRGGGQRGGGPPWRTAADTARAHRLYVSTDPQDMPAIDSAAGERQIADRLKTEEFFRQKS